MTGVSGNRMREPYDRRTYSPSPTAASRKRLNSEPAAPSLESELQKVVVNELDCVLCQQRVALVKLEEDVYVIKEHVRPVKPHHRCGGSNVAISAEMLRELRLSAYLAEMEIERLKTDAREQALKSEEKIMPNRLWHDGTSPSRSLKAVSAPPPGSGKRR